MAMDNTYNKLISDTKRYQFVLRTIAVTSCKLVENATRTMVDRDPHAELNHLAPNPDRVL